VRLADANAYCYSHGYTDSYGRCYAYNYSYFNAKAYTDAAISANPKGSSDTGAKTLIPE
jgi:hypothetical protein